MSNKLAAKKNNNKKKLNTNSTKNTSSDSKYYKMNRLQIITNAVFFHSHLLLYFAIFLAVTGLFTWMYFNNVWVMILIPFCLIPSILYYIDIMIGRTIKVEGVLKKKKNKKLFTVYNLKEEDNICYQCELIEKDGSVHKVYGYKRTFTTTFNAKARYTRHNVKYNCTYYYLPITKVIVDIDYKCC